MPRYDLKDNWVSLILGTVSHVNTWSNIDVSLFSISNTLNFNSSILVMTSV